MTARRRGNSFGGKEDDRVKPGHDEEGDYYLSGLPEQDFPLRVAHRFLIGRGRTRIGFDHGGAFGNVIEPALQMREGLEILLVALVRDDPGIARHVGNAVITGKVLAFGQALVQHAIKP